MDFAVRAFHAVLSYQNSAPLYVSNRPLGGDIPPPSGALLEIIIEKGRKPMKKRLLSLALSLALCMGLAVPALAEEETGGAGGDSETTVPVESVTLSGDGLENGTLETGTGVYFTLTATVMPENATDKTVIWTSGDDEIATVEDGIVTGLSVGETTVTATAGGKSATCTVKVTEEFGTDAGEKVTITFKTRVVPLFISVTPAKVPLKALCKLK